MTAKPLEGRSLLLAEAEDSSFSVRSLDPSDGNADVRFRVPGVHSVAEAERSHVRQLRRQ